MTDFYRTILHRRPCHLWHSQTTVKPLLPPRRRWLGLCEFCFQPLSSTELELFLLKHKPDRSHTTLKTTTPSTPFPPSPRTFSAEPKCNSDTMAYMSIFFPIDQSKTSSTFSPIYSLFETDLRSLNHRLHWVTPQHQRHRIVV